MSTEFYELLGSRIKRRREEIKMRQSELAESVGLSRTSVTNIERGRQRLFLDQFVEICKVLGVALENLIPVPQPRIGGRQSPQLLQSTHESVRKFLDSIDSDDKRVV